MKKQDPTIYCLKETHFTYKDTYKLNVKGWRKLYHANTKQKKSEVAILFSDRADFRGGKLSEIERGITQ